MHGVVWSSVLAKTHTAILHIEHMDLGSTMRCSQAAPVYRAIAQLVEQVKRSFVKSSCSNFLLEWLPVSPVRVRLALLNKIIIYFGAIAQWQSKESCQRFLQQQFNISVRIRIAPIGAVVQMDRTICQKELCQKRLQQLSSHHIGRRFEACQLRFSAVFMHWRLRNPGASALNILGSVK